MSDNSVSNAATEHVLKMPDNPVAAYVADHGHGRVDVEQRTIAGRRITVSTNLTLEERDYLADVIRMVEPTVGRCFSNALRAWEYDSSFNYVEGWATADDVGGLVHEHAWNTLNGKLVDITTEFDEYHGVVISDASVLARYYELGVEEEVWGILGNHRDRFAFLRERGYL